jgi:hypothetical protein
MQLELIEEQRNCLLVGMMENTESAPSGCAGHRGKKDLLIDSCRLCFAPIELVLGKS